MIKIKYKILTIAFRVLRSLAPAYFSKTDLSPSFQLFLSIPSSWTSQFLHRSTVCLQALEGAVPFLPLRTFGFFSRINSIHPEGLDLSVTASGGPSHPLQKRLVLGSLNIPFRNGSHISSNNYDACWGLTDRQYIMCFSWFSYLILIITHVDMKIGKQPRRLCNFP